MNIEEIEEAIPHISDDTQYWLVRTFGGQYYEHFVNNDCIAIGWDEVTYEDLSKLHKDRNNRSLKEKLLAKIEYKGLSENLSTKRKYKQRVLKQLLKFAFNIKKGDYIVIPGFGSHEFAFGIVEETPVYTNIGMQGLRKQKKVKWIKADISRLNLTYQDFKFFHARQTITNISEYKETINPLVFDLYNYNGKYNLTLRVQRKEEVDGMKMLDFIGEFVSTIKDYDKESPQLKISVKSPGVIIIAGIALGGFLTLGMSSILRGGKSKTRIKLWKQEYEHESNGKGLLEAISDYQDRKLERKRKQKLYEGMEYFDIEPNKELLNHFKSKTQNEISKVAEESKNLLEKN